jgi:NAD(P)-dependent dehydrogenase (short-subunit alcohol dehydrogenase family)
VQETLLQHQHAVVIGGGSVGVGVGIGRAVACAFARCGARVSVCDANLEAAIETVDLIERAGGEALALTVDVLDEASIVRAMAQASAHFGPVSILHNNVGLGKSGSSDRTTVNDWRRIQDANVTALHVSCQAVLPAMLEAGQGVLLVTSSVAAIGHVGYPHLAYSTSKAAAAHFARLMAVEYGPCGIRSNAIIAGLIDTPRIEQTVAPAYRAQGITDWRAARAAAVPMRRMGSAEEVAACAVFLCSSQASYVNGVCLRVDGGLGVTLAH